MLLTMLLLAAAPADPAADKADARCLVAAARLEDVADAADKADVRAMMLYYLGKLAGRHAAAAEIRAIVDAVEPEVAEDQVASLATACADGMVVLDA